MEKEKRKMSEETKKHILLAVKIIAVCIFAVVYSLLYIQGLYKDGDTMVASRIVIPTLILVVPCVLLFVKIKLPNVVNNILSILLSIFVIVENFVMLQVSQGYEYSNFGKTLTVLNLIIIATIFMVSFGIFNSFKVSIIVVNAVTVIFGVANYFVVLFRGTGVLAVDVLDLETATNVAGGYSYTLDYYVYLLIMCQVAISFIVVKLGKNKITPGKWRFIPAVLAVCCIVFSYNIFFASDKYDKLLDVKYFKPQETFNTNGMYATFVMSIKDLMVEAPEGYSVEAVEELAKQYTGTESTVSEDEQPNIIMIMDEAFNDFSSFIDLQISEDCVPFYHSLTENTIRGQMFVSVFGGGTATTEFEVLTSNSMAFIPSATAYSTYINDPMASITTTLSSQNYGGLLAMHPYKGNDYKRNKVYPLLGFSEFITQDDFDSDVDTLGGHISDKADVERIISEYEGHRKEDDSPFWMFNVTMQNHSPFDAEDIENEITLDYDIDAPEAQKFVNYMKYTDDALKELVEYFENVDEPTIIVFYGDHQPRVENSFYKAIKKDYQLDDVYKENLWKRNTQFLIWANYDIEEQDDVYISSNYLTSLVLDTAGLAKTGYQQFVSEVREQVPILTKYGYVGSDGNFYENGDIDSPYYDILSRYNILEYNNIFDVDNRVESLFYLDE